MLFACPVSNPLARIPFAGLCRGLVPALLVGGAAVAQSPWLPHPTAGACDDRVLADLDGDGAADLVSSDANIDSLRVQLGRGDGSFGPLLSYAAGSISAKPGYLHCADADLDGDLDVLTDATVEWGNGLGGLAGSAVIPWPPGPSKPYLVADVDGTGAVDLVAPSNGALICVPLLGGGAFGTPVISPAGLTGSATDSVLLDVNHDGALDIVEARLAQISLRTGIGNGAFLPEQPLIGAFGVKKLARADLDGDGDADLCGVIGGASDLGLAWTQQFGGFALVHSFAFTAAGEQQLELADVDGDGRIDFLVHETNYYLHRFAGQAGPSFGAGEKHFLGEASVGFRLADIDLDGHLDAVGYGRPSSPSYASLFWRFGTATGFGGTSAATLPPYIQQAVAGHFAAGAGIGAVVETSDGAVRSLEWLRVDPSGVFQPLASTPLPLLGASSKLARVDHDGDGRDSLVRAASAASVDLFDVSSPGAPLYTIPTVEQLYSVAAADFDGNGQEDVIVCAGFSGCVPIRFTPGGWSALPSVSTAAVGEHPIAAAVAQLDGSGAPDLVALHLSGLVTWCAGNGDGTFGAPVTIGSVGQPLSVHAFDIDGDGRLDVHVTSGLANGTLFSFAQPGGVFAATPVIIGCGPQFGLGDIDLDGKLDLVTSGAMSSVVVVRRGTDSPSGFAPIPQEVNFAGGESALSNVLAVEDVDGDGRVDILLSGGIRIGLMKHAAYATPGTQIIGAGTSGCAGPHDWSALNQPIVGNKSFALRGDAAPANGAGIVLISAQADAAGSDPFQLGPLFHVGLGGAFLTGVHANGAGLATKQIPVPNDPALVATQLTTQALWLWSSGPCAPTQPFALSSSPGLTLTFLP